MNDHLPRPTVRPAGGERWGRAATLLLATLGLLLPPAASPRPAAAATPTYGSEAGLNYVGDMLTESDASLTSDLDLVRSTGVAYLRLAFDWSRIQAGGATSWDWAPTDRVVTGANQRGLRILAVLVNSPRWETGLTSAEAPPQRASDWFAFAQHVGQRYIHPPGTLNVPTVSAFELWNEPNLSTAWFATPNPANYVNLVLKPGYSALHGVAASRGTAITVITGGLAPTTTWGVQVSPIDFLTRIYSDGGGGSFDAAGLHPYTQPDGPMVDTTGSRSVFYHAPDFHQVMAVNGDGAKLVWATEIGWPTGPCSGGCVTLQQQANMIPLAYSQWRAWTFTGPMLWFQVRDSGTNPLDAMRNFGLVRYDFSTKPALPAFTSFMATSPP